MKKQKWVFLRNTVYRAYDTSRCALQADIGLQKLIHYNIITIT